MYDSRFSVYRADLSFSAKKIQKPPNCAPSHSYSRLAAVMSHLTFARFTALPRVACCLCTSNAVSGKLEQTVHRELVPPNCTFYIFCFINYLYFLFSLPSKPTYIFTDPTVSVAFSLVSFRLFSSQSTNIHTSISFRTDVLLQVQKV